MKNQLRLLIVVLVISAMLTACGVPSVKPISEGTTSQQNSIQEPDIPAQANAPSQTDSAQQTAAPEQTEPTKKPANKNAEVAETVVLDDMGVKVTVKGFEKGIFGPELRILVENNSGKNLTIQTRNSSVNGYMIDTMLSVDVADGKKANDAVIFSDSDLELCGIEEFAILEFAFHIFTSDDWETYLDTEAIHLETSIAEGFQCVFNDSGEVLLDENGIKIVSKGVLRDSLFGKGVVVYIENNSGKNITVQARDISVNGFMIDAMFSCDVLDGKHAVDEITFMSSDLEKNGIDKIEEVELSFHIFDLSSWDTILDTNPVSLKY